MNNFQGRTFGAYSRCKWCQGRGCLACGPQSDADYKKAFPDGPKPILTVANDDADGMSKLASILSAAGLTAAREEAKQRTDAELANTGVAAILHALGYTQEQAKPALVASATTEVLTMKLEALGDELKKRDNTQPT
jgi:hypothetical protein